MTRWRLCTYHRCLRTRITEVSLGIPQAQEATAELNDLEETSQDARSLRTEIWAAYIAEHKNSQRYEKKMTSLVTADCSGCIEFNISRIKKEQSCVLLCFDKHGQSKMSPYFKIITETTYLHSREPICLLWISNDLNFHKRNLVKCGLWEPQDHVTTAFPFFFAPLQSLDKFRKY